MTETLSNWSNIVIYIAIAVIAFFAVDLVYTMTEYRPDRYHRVDIQLVGNTIFGDEALTALRSGDVLQYDLSFAPEAPREQMALAMQALFENAPADVQTVSCRLLLEDTVALQSRLERAPEGDPSELRRISYENTLPVLKARAADARLTGLLMELVRPDLPAADLMVQHSLLPGTLLLQVNTDSAVDPALLEGWRAGLLRGLEDRDLGGPFDRLVLQLYVGSRLYHESVHLQGEGWLPEGTDWMNPPTAATPPWFAADAAEAPAA